MKRSALMFASTLLLAGASVAAQQPADIQAATRSVIGTRDVTVADPAVPRPGTEPCIVQLFPATRFGKPGNNARMDATPHPFHYRPPAHCNGPWAKVVLEANFSVDAGHQYDRSASIWLRGVNLYFGTTEEPSPGVTRSWNVQRDLTDYASLLRQPGTGAVVINNWIGDVFASPIHARARLLFYPADDAYPVPAVPDRIVALNRPHAAPAKVDDQTGPLSRQVTFPRNTTRVYLDLIAQPQAHDEFYYMCLDNRVIARVGRPRSSGSLDRPRTCGGGSFREVIVRIDGQRAALAPVAPWIYTGGLDPFLWQPTPAAEALNFMPDRIDLTPFAGMLSDGKAHTVSIGVLGHPDFFSVAGALLVYQDAHAAHTGGAVTRNTLQTSDLTPSLADTLITGARGVDGGVFTRAEQHYVIEGYVATPRGRVPSRVDTRIKFENTQRFRSGEDDRHHVTRQRARVDRTSYSAGPNVPPRRLRQTIRYALDVDTLGTGGERKTKQRDVQVRQRFTRHIIKRDKGLPPYLSNMSNTLVAAGRLNFERGKRTSYQSHDQSSMQTFQYRNSLGDCYHASVRARDRKVAGDTRGTGCLQTGAVHWFVHPDGSPDSFGWRGIVTPPAAASGGAKNTHE